MSYLSEYEQRMEPVFPDEILEEIPLKVSFCNQKLTVESVDMLLLSMGPVQSIDLSNNLIENIPSSIPSTLIYLNLSNNLLQNGFRSQIFNNLKELDLSYNSLESLTGLSVCHHLEILHASYNNISDVGGVESLVHLKFLDLEHNSIATLKALRCISFLRELRDLILKGNPIDRTSSRKSLKIFITNSLPNLKELNKSPCRRRLSLQSQTINNEVKYSELYLDNPPSDDRSRVVRTPLPITSTSPLKSLNITTGSFIIDHNRPQSGPSPDQGHASTHLSTSIRSTSLLADGYRQNRPVLVQSISPPRNTLKSLTPTTASQPLHQTIASSNQSEDPPNVFKYYYVPNPMTVDALEKKRQEEIVQDVYVPSRLVWRNPPNPMPRPFKGKQLFSSDVLLRRRSVSASRRQSEDGTSLVSKGFQTVSGPDQYMMNMSMDELESPSIHSHPPSIHSHPASPAPHSSHLDGLQGMLMDPQSGHEVSGLHFFDPLTRSYFHGTAVLPSSPPKTKSRSLSNYRASSGDIQSTAVQSIGRSMESSDSSIRRNYSFGAIHPYLSDRSQPVGRDPIDPSREPIRSKVLNETKRLKGSASSIEGVVSRANSKKISGHKPTNSTLLRAAHLAAKRRELELLNNKTALKQFQHQQLERIKRQSPHWQSARPSTATARDEKVGEDAASVDLRESVQTVSDEKIQQKDDGLTPDHDSDPNNQSPSQHDRSEQLERPEREAVSEVNVNETLSSIIKMEQDMLRKIISAHTQSGSNHPLMAYDGSGIDYSSGSNPSDPTAIRNGKEIDLLYDLVKRRSAFYPQQQNSAVAKDTPVSSVEETDRRRMAGSIELLDIQEGYAKLWNELYFKAASPSKMDTFQNNLDHTVPSYVLASLDYDERLGKLHEKNFPFLDMEGADVSFQDLRLSINQNIINKESFGTSFHDAALAIEDLIVRKRAAINEMTFKDVKY